MASSAKHFTTKKGVSFDCSKFLPQLFNPASVYLIFCFSESFFFLIWLCPKLTCPKGQNCDLYTVGFYLKKSECFYHFSFVTNLLCEWSSKICISDTRNDMSTLGSRLKNVHTSVDRQICHYPQVNVPLLPPPSP